jgi:hypothetical protein
MRPSVFASTSLAVAALLSAGSAAAAPSAYYDPNYAASVNDYENQRDAYANAQDEYRARQAAYARQRADYEAARRDYDRRYGYGAYERQYGVFRYSGDVDSRAYVDSSCRDRRTGNGLAGGVIGGIAGAVIGSNIGRHDRTSGAVIGGVVGALAGNAIGRSTVHCDSSGYYYSYNDTAPYDRSYPGGRYSSDYYVDRDCRVARDDVYGYVRVCPDRYGRYRVTG